MTAIMLRHLHREVLLDIFSYLDAHSLLRVGATARAFFPVASDATLWETLLARLRAGDTWAAATDDTNYCTRLARTARSAKNAYWVEVNEGHRTVLTADDFLTALPWAFRFKASGGEVWTQADPWHQGRPPMGQVLTRTGPKRGEAARVNNEMTADWDVHLEWDLLWENGTDPGSLLTPTSTDFIGGSSNGHVAVPTHCGTRPQRASLRALTRHVRSRDRAGASPVALRDAFNSGVGGSSSSSSAPEPRRSQRLQKVATGDELSRVRALYAISGNSLRFKVLSSVMLFFLLPVSPTRARFHPDSGERRARALILAHHQARPRLPRLLHP